jgi:hypothetical protein
VGNLILPLITKKALYYQTNEEKKVKEKENLKGV